MNIFTTFSPIFDSFEFHGYQLYYVGGCVRDNLLGLTSFTDVDLCTNALPEETREILKSLGANIFELNGGNFGTIHCEIFGMKIEITTFREDILYKEDSRRPVVKFSSSLEDDLIRRDFTINSIAMDRDGEVVNNTISEKGFLDLQNSKLVAPRDPMVMFREDPLRILRMYRFAHRFELMVDNDLRSAARMLCGLLAEKKNIISRERVNEEFIKIASLPKCADAFRDMIYDGVMYHIFPKLSLFLGKGYYHSGLSIVESTLKTVEEISLIEESYQVRIAALLQDTLDLIGSAYTLEKDLEALKFSNKDVQLIIHVADQAGRLLQGLGWFLEDEEGPPTERYVRYCIHHAGDDYKEIIALASIKYKYLHPEIQGMLDVFISLLDNLDIDSVVNPKKYLDGNEVMKILDIKPSPVLGNIMQAMTMEVVRGAINSREDAVKWLLQKNNAVGS